MPPAPPQDRSSVPKGVGISGWVLLLVLVVPGGCRSKRVEPPSVGSASAAEPANPVDPAAPSATERQGLSLEGASDPAAAAGRAAPTKPAPPPTGSAGDENARGNTVTPASAGGVPAAKAADRPTGADPLESDGDGPEEPATNLASAERAGKRSPAPALAAGSAAEKATTVEKRKRTPKPEEAAPEEAAPEEARAEKSEGDGGETKPEKTKSGETAEDTDDNADQDTDEAPPRTRRADEEAAPAGTGSAYAARARALAEEDEAAAGAIPKGEMAEPAEPPAAGPGPSRAYVDSARVKRFLAEGGAELRGRLVDATSGAGVAGAAVEAWMGTRSLHVATDDDGRFVFEGLSPGSRLTLWMTGPSHFVQERTELVVPPKEAPFTRSFSLLDRRTAKGSTSAGIGVFLSRAGNRTVVSDLVAFGPAEAAGAAKGDVVLAVNGRDVRGLGPGAVAYLLGGQLGTEIEVTLQRPGQAPRKLVMKRVGK